MLQIKNVNIFTEDHQFVPGEILVEGDRIAAVKTQDSLSGFDIKDKEVIEIDGNGAYAIPGLIDTHIHGSVGYDFGDGTEVAVHEIAKYQASQGVLAFAPTTMTVPVEDLCHILETGASYKKKQDGLSPKDPERFRAADVIGFNMEGPFISKVKKGAQDEKYILPCDVGIARSFLEASDGLVKFIGIAPEDNEDCFEEFIRELKGEVVISLAHTNANYEQASRAMDAGASRSVHLFNAMSPFTHRDTGVPGATFDHDQVWAELICDGFHVSGPAVRTVFKLGADRVVMVSDTMRAAGLDDGEYTLGGQAVEVRDHGAYMKGTNTIAASVTNLKDALKVTVKKMNIPLEQAVAAATENAAKSAGIYDEYGSLTAGKKAHILLLDDDLEPFRIIKDGQII